MSRLEFSIERLIQEVKKRRLLYDTTVDEYRNKNAKEQEWIDVCREVCTTNSVIGHWDNLRESEKTDFLMEVKKKWTSLRDCFKREHRLFQNNEHNKRKYLFFDQLLFLEPFTKVRGPNKPSVKQNDESKNIVQEEVFIEVEDIKPDITIFNNSTISEDEDETPLQVVKAKNTTNTIKILTPQELQKIGGNKIVFVEEKETSRTLHNNERDGDIEVRKRKWDRGRNRDNYDSSKVRKDYIEDYGETSNCIEKKKEIEDTNKSDEDDQAFLKSILPTFKELTTEQKFRLRIEIMQTILKFKLENQITN